MLSWSDAAVLERMRKGWRGGESEGTPCGTGSRKAGTREIRKYLPGLLEKFGVRSVCDAGAGDLYWKVGPLKGVQYQAFDLVPRCTGVQKWDITKTALPACDLILCRQVLIHLDPPRVKAALALFRESAPLLLASTYDVENVFDPARQFNKTNLSAAPYGLGPPVSGIVDCKGLLALWRLNEVSSL